MKRDKIDKLIINKQREKERERETVVYQYFNPIQISFKKFNSAQEGW